MPDLRLPWTLRAGLAIVGLLLLTALAAPWLAPHDPNDQADPALSHLRPPGTHLLALRLANGEVRLAEAVHPIPGGVEVERFGRRERLDERELAPESPRSGTLYRFPLGSDRFGRDVASRLLYGARASLGIGVVGSAIALLLGVLIGSAAALGGPFLDSLLMRATDALMAIPTLFLIIAFATLLPPGITATILLFGFTSWIEPARVARAEILALKGRDFIVAARTIGLGPFAIYFRHILPNVWTPMLIRATLLIGNLILAEAGLSFLGLGIQPPSPTWGNMISDGQGVLVQAPWISLFPGLALAFTVLGFNLCADGLRDLFDSRGSHNLR